MVILAQQVKNFRSVDRKKANYSEFYETKTIEGDVINTEVHKVKSKIRIDVK